MFGSIIRIYFPRCISVVYSIAKMSCHLIALKVNMTFPIRPNPFFIAKQSKIEL